MQEDDVRKLIYLARLGDFDAVECLYRLFKQCVYKTYLECSGNFEASDFMSECEGEFMHWLKYYCMYEKCSFTTYICVCAQRKLYYLVNKETRHGRVKICSFDDVGDNHPGSYLDTVAEERVEYNPEGLLHFTEEQAEHRKLVGQYIPGKRMYEVFELSNLGYAPSENALKLNVSIRTVYNVLYRIRHSVREKQKNNDEINESTKDV
jgi:DNA-directed RNA polymerase specialized sigma24 family protein